MRRRHAFQLHVAWVPGHTDVAGNELADAHAKLAAEDDETEHGITALKRTLPRSAAAVKASYKHAVTAQRASWWATSPAAAKLARIDNDGSSAHVRRLYADLPRRAASLLTQLRTGHVGLNGFLARIRVEPSARHASRYFELYLPIGAVEIPHTTLYEHKTEKSELCIIATRALALGSLITDLKVLFASSEFRLDILSLLASRLSRQGPRGRPSRCKIFEWPALHVRVSGEHVSLIMAKHYLTSRDSFNDTAHWAQLYVGIPGRGSAPLTTNNTGRKPTVA
ncbi:hypothetical protein EXIGLDRAFT_767188 [Exidia glandulosa HHB12029]|uniref:RNase H type-1 domain-containing protein n=1 Tax=Exidia glandulosa HHB12029 TaxID=1314781 RepID=A0A165J4V1_EXIGL|nr:hypothetical protein EXIGLDRAFT_767188 [Exidia glandulosa HHB12029]